MAACHIVPGLARGFFLLYINNLESQCHVPLSKYVDDSTLFEICKTNDLVLSWLIRLSDR